MDVIAAKDRARLAAEDVNAATFGKQLHHVVDMIVLDDVALALRRLGAPLPPDGDAAVRQVVDLAVGNYRSLSKADPDSDAPVVGSAAQAGIKAEEQG